VVTLRVLSHGQTYQSHLLACAAALEVQRCLQKDKLVDRCRDLGNYLLSQLKAQLGEMPFVGDIRGRGLFVGVEFVVDKKSKEPFPSAKNVAGQVHAAALRHGLATYPGTGTADGVRGDHILLAPPFIITTDDIDSLVLRLGKAITDVTKEFHL
jgi:Adenosylmethionine-8-amino-7-oxononanoate aminotransferase